jgi:type IV pilus assembly protein PilP
MRLKRKYSVLPSLFPCFAVLLLAGCGGDMADMDAYMQGVRGKSIQPIDPVPSLPQYDVFIYGAAGLRSPFERPQAIQDLAGDGAARTEVVKPDELRAKEYLEQFNLSSIVMVGSVVKGGIAWGLVDDGTGNIQRVRAGNYMGRNYGKIYYIDESRIDLREIVPSGSVGWVERQKTLKLSERMEK